jgi:hypothetical protein
MARKDDDNRFEEDWRAFYDGKELGTGLAPAGPVAVGPTSVVDKNIQFVGLADSSPEWLLGEGTYNWTFQVWTEDTDNPSLSFSKTFSVDKTAADTLRDRRQKRDNTWSTLKLE